MKSVGTTSGSVSMPFNCGTVLRSLTDLSTSSLAQTDPDLYTLLDQHATRPRGSTSHLCQHTSPPR